MISASLAFLGLGQFSRTVLFPLEQTILISNLTLRRLIEGDPTDCLIGLGHLEPGPGLCGPKDEENLRKAILSILQVKNRFERPQRT